jgi:hypothetical protein
VSSLNENHLISVGREDNLWLDADDLDGIDYFESRSGINELQVIVGDQHTIIPFVWHVKAAYYLRSIYIVDIQGFLSNI